VHITTLAQKNITVFSGYNFSTIKYNQDNINENVNFNSHRGLNIGIEYRFPKIIAGFGYFQRGSGLSRATKLNIGGIDYNIDISGHEVYNYLSAHLVYPYKINQSLELFGGIQIGKSNNGESLAKLKFTDFNSSRSDNIELKSEDFNIDQGIKLGMNYMLNPKFGFRASYFSGLMNVRSNLDDSLNYKNNSFQASLLINFKNITIKSPKNLLDSTKSIRSKLIIPAKSIYVQVGSKADNSANVKSSLSVNYGVRDNVTVGVRKNEHLETLDIYIRTNYFNKFLRKINYPINIVYHSAMSNKRNKSVIIDEVDNFNFLHKTVFEYKIRASTILHISPMYVHKNIAKTKLEPKGFPWDLWFLEAGFNQVRNQKFYIYGSAYRLIKDAELANSISFYSLGVRYNLKLIELDFSLSNISNTYETALADEINSKKSKENIRFGFQINKTFN
tara:strand:- start:387 stop:1724 length:1338 start_codon:yes stop_codon:yes gene_type:complete